MREIIGVNVHFMILSKISDYKQFGIHSIILSPGL